MMWRSTSLSFYPSTPEKLTGMIDRFLAGTKKVNISGKPFAIIVPHAGYVYSGKVAAWGFRQIEDLTPTTVFLLGSSHNWGFRGASVPAYESYQSPLGPVPVNRQIIARLLKNPNIKENVTFRARRSMFDMGMDKNVHEVEHTLEVEIPFLQRMFKNFSIVPVLFGTDDPAITDSVAKSIAEICAEDPGALIVCSTDLTHYPPLSGREKNRYGNSR